MGRNAWLWTARRWPSAPACGAGWRENQPFDLMWSLWSVNQLAGLSFCVLPDFVWPVLICVVIKPCSSDRRSIPMIKAACGDLDVVGSVRARSAACDDFVCTADDDGGRDGGGVAVAGRDRRVVAFGEGG
ncbi:hypothetical protein Arub01_35450 [Actinomadura rubrobrunea]|uniref:Uncharacterized protein n=1 Tax=Actinomadura rubrobrunea TaxID=115335 RepID=A0A9W6PYJ4_9ACTN|nr:hypothetical protein Arub01_35450 [Actinomadura rubrobrunea]